MDDDDEWLVVAPALAGDPIGHRIGYGKGFYDRLLARICPPAFAIAVAYDFEVVPEVPADAHDHAVDLAVTDLRRWQVARAGGGRSGTFEVAHGTGPERTHRARSLRSRGGSRRKVGRQDDAQEGFEAADARSSAIGQASGRRAGDAGQDLGTAAIASKSDCNFGL